MRQTLWVPGALWDGGSLPGQNEIIAACKGFRGRGTAFARMKRVLTDSIAGLARVNQLEPMSAAYFTFEWREKAKRRDPDNLTAAQKFVFDGLVSAGVLPNDGWGQVLGISHSWEVGAPPGVLVTLSDEPPS